MSNNSFDEALVSNLEPDPAAPMDVAVNALGKKALAILLDLEDWIVCQGATKIRGTPDENGYGCRVCGNVAYHVSHEVELPNGEYEDVYDCKWGAIVAEVKKLREKSR